MAYQPRCLTCNHRLREGDDYEQVQLNPPLFIHATWEGCQQAEARSGSPREARSTRGYLTLEQIEKTPDTPWKRRH